MRAKPDGLIVGIGMLPSRESTSTRMGGRGCQLRGLLQPSEMKSWEAGLDSAVLSRCEKPEAIIAPGAHPEFPWEPDLSPTSILYFVHFAALFSYIPGSLVKWLLAF